MRRFSTLLLTLVLLLALIPACQEEPPPPPPEEEEPPPKTAQQLYKTIEQSMTQPLSGMTAAPAQNTGPGRRGPRGRRGNRNAPAAPARRTVRRQPSLNPFSGAAARTPAEERAYRQALGQKSALTRKLLSGPDVEPSTVLGAVRMVKSKLAAEENGAAALARFQGDVTEAIQTARDHDDWEKVLLGIQIYEVLDPASERYAKLKERAETIAKCPGVQIKGFFEVDNQLYAFLIVTDPQTREQETYRVREGEEFHNGLFKLLRIIGNQERCEIIYAPINDTFTLNAPTR